MENDEETALDEEQIREEVAVDRNNPGQSIKRSFVASTEAQQFVRLEALA